MKKMSLSVQITLVFIFSFLATSLLLGIFISNKLEDVYVDNIFEKLEAEGKALKQNRDLSYYQQNDEIAYIYYMQEENLYITSENIEKFINDDNAIKLLINKAVMQEKGSEQYINTIDDKTVYYVVFNYQGFYDIQSNEIYIVLTDDKMKSNMVRSTTSQIVSISVIAFLLGYLLILLWVSRLVRDTKKVSSIVSEVGNRQYHAKIKTKRRDEIGSLVDNIELMRNKIVENEKQKQEIIQGVSHDLKTPIAVIQSYAEALGDQMCEADEVAEITKRECKRLNDKVTKLLHLTRLQYIDHQHNDYGETDIKDVLDKVVLSYKYQTKSKIEVIGEAQLFKGDKESWLIVVENLLDNAIRYSESEIIITIDRDKLSVYNDGSHIKKSDLLSIFNAYEKSIDGKFGLGLSIVKRTVKLFGYTVSVKNIRKGVTFIIEKEE